MTTFILIPFNGTDATEAPSFTSDFKNVSASIVGSLWNNLTNNGHAGNYTPSYHEEDPYGYSGEDSGYGSDNYYVSEKAKYGDEYSYGKMSVAVLSLCLVIGVEAILRRIDGFAAGKPFGIAVLDAVYRELAVLGIVELGLHIITQFYTFDKDSKAVFADIHFLLFYTDIFNACQAVIQAFATQRVSKLLWVRTEDLEVDHYVEIREEFDRIHEKLYGVPPDMDCPSLSERSHHANSHRPRRAGMINSLLHPGLRAKYKELLLQVRFHELRVNFLRQYKLPLKLKVSDYLMRSESAVLISLVHISPSAWIWLTAVCNLLYFAAGIILEITEDAHSSAKFYSVVFFVGIFLFIGISLMVDAHMQWIMNRIMKSKHLWAFNDGKEAERDEELAAEQRSLFFLGDPDWIVTMAQFTQLGYAISFAIVFTFWRDMERDFVSPFWFLWATVLCYSVFVYNLARAIPRYTLCSTLGQLVDKNLLNESVAAFKLREAERCRANKGSNEDDADGDLGSVDCLTDQICKTNSKDSDSDYTKLSVTDSTTVTSNAQTISTAPSPDIVRIDTSALGGVTRPMRTERRKKAQSEGVALMRQMPVNEQPGNDDNTAVATSEDVTTRRHRRKKSLSEGVAVMQPLSSVSFIEPESPREKLLADFVTMDTKDLKKILSSMESSGTHGRTRSRQRSNSDGDSSMAIMEDSAGSPRRQMSDASAIRQMHLGEDSCEQTRSSCTRQSSASSEVLQLRQGGRPLETVLSNDPMDDNVSSDGGMIVPQNLFDSERWTIHQFGAVHEPKSPSPSVHERVCDFFIGPSFRLGSHVLGTMCCFFFVAMRVEGFLKKQCLIPKDDHSWEMPLEYSFLLTAIWLLAGLAVSTSVVCSFAAKKTLTRSDWKAVVAAILDLALVGTCLGLFLGAESHRCCSSDSDDSFNYENIDPFVGIRFLKEYGNAAKEVCIDETLECTCPPFGHRTSGGLGHIEPWTALIALQAFRFLVAKRIVKRLQLGEEHHIRNGHHSDDHHDDAHGHGHGHGHSSQDVIADAWHRAVVKHPDLVEKYGEFSGEILQAMMGLTVVEGRNRSSPVQLKDVPDNKRGNRFVLKDDRYKSLAPEAQEIILAGKFGKPVKVCSARQALRKSSSTPMAPLEFEVDVQRNKVEKLHLSTTLFEYPNARIIRSVRRCDRMYLPLLKTWTAVDVILTQHEMIYVDVNGSDDCTFDPPRAKACIEALVATNGGKGLRLCDIAGSRRIVGRLSLSDITTVEVDRERPGSKNFKLTEASTRELDVDVENTEIKPAELWQAGGDGDFVSSALTNRWEVVVQNRLKIQTSSGTLYLRFYADLIDSEMHPQRNWEHGGDDSPQIAFQWAQTIVHMCVHQLKQDLPRIGNNHTSELRDSVHSDY